MPISFRTIKGIQISVLFLSIIFLLLAVGCIEMNCSPIWDIPYRGILRYFFLSISDATWQIAGIPFLLILQAICLICFFLIAFFLSLKIIPAPINESEEEKILASPYDAFNKIIFSKILIGSVIGNHQNIVDARNVKISSVADLYLLHLKMSGKLYGLVFVAFIIFFGPYQIGVHERAATFQLVVNFVHLNLFLFLMLEICIYILCKRIGRKNNG
jgi:hypothetical protein